LSRAASIPHLPPSDAAGSGLLDARSLWPQTALALAFALMVNQGVVYYVARFSAGVSFRSPWPVLAITLALIAVALLSSRMHVSFAKVMLLFGALNVAFAISTLWSPSLDYGPYKAKLTLLIPMTCIAVGYLTTEAGRLRIVLICFAAVAAAAGATFFLNGHTAALFAQDERTSTVLITYQNFSLAMALGAIWALDRLTDRLPKIDAISIAFLVCCVLFILVSGGRGGLLIAIIATLAMAIARVRRKWLGAGVAALLIGLLLVLGLVIQSYAHEIWANPDLPQTLRRIVYYSFIQTGAVTDARDIFFGLALEVFLSAPMLGVGWGGFPPSAGLPDAVGFYPHNLVLELLAETGVVGFAAFTGLFAWIVIAFLRSPGPVDQRSIILSILVAGLAASMVGGDWPSQRLLFFAIGAMAGFIARHGSSWLPADVLPRIPLVGRT
jgi:O-antigen ligase